MIKVVTKYLIFFCCLLILGQSSLLYAFSYSNATLLPSIRGGANYEYFSGNSSQKEEAIFTQKNPHDIENYASKLEVFLFENEENDESDSYNKYTSNNPSDLFQVLSHIYNYGHLVSCHKYLSSASPNKHLLFGVFRI